MIKRFSHYKLIDDTIEIDGIRMHQTSRKNPTQDASDKVNLIPLNPSYIALDICTGLGYNAIFLSKKVKRVITIENDPYVLKMAKENKLSKNLFNNEKILQIIGDAFNIVKVFPANFFHVIYHDPPRLKRAGNLYSEEFYKDLFRILRNNKWLFHYTGKPGEKKGKNIPAGVKKRLTLAGFTKIEWIENCLGFIAKKEL